MSPKRTINCFKVFKSSAGSGKTYTLVKEYLKIVLLNPEKLSSILAITFTNEAATEMKTRIISELSGIISLRTNPQNRKSLELLNQIVEELSKELNDAVSFDLLISNASKVLTTILHRYSDFSVSTIDSFVHGIIRTFAHDLNAPARFDTELDTDHILTKAVDLLISRLKLHDPIANAITLHVINQFDQNQSTYIEQSLIKLAKTLLDEKTQPHLKSLRNYKVSEVIALQHMVKKSLADMEQNVRIAAQGALALIQSVGLEQDDFLQKSTGIYGYFKNMAEGNIHEKIIAGANVLKTIHNDQWYAATLPKSKKDAVDAISSKLADAYHDIHGPLGEKTIQYRLLHLVSRFLLPVGLLGEIKDVLDRLKADENKLFISDFTQLIAEAIAGEPVPYIYERLGARFDHFMIDEFQDTSVLQWHNLVPLIDNGLATANLSLIVGDAKQAIYRWRNGDVSQFANLPLLPHANGNPVLEGFQGSLIRNYEEKSLNVNYRTQKHIVEFNNGFFTACNTFLKDPLKKIYDNPAQNFRSAATEGYVEVSFLSESNNDDPKDSLMAGKVLEIISRLVDSGHAYSDIAILCRSNANGSFLARHLLGAGIPVVSPESLLLHQSYEVVFIMALLKLLANRHDAIAAIESLHYVASHLAYANSHELPQWIADANAASGQHHMPDTDWCKAFDNLMEHLGHSFRLEKLRHQNPYDSVQIIVHSFFTSEPPSPFVLFFLDAVFDFSQKHLPSLLVFLQWWDEHGKRVSIALPHGIDAVQISTIHKSKGLEYPVVIHPFFSLSNARLGTNNHWISPDIPSIPGLPPVFVQLSQKSFAGTPLEALLEEETNFSMLDKINLAYVAFTRAKEKLFVIANEPNPNKLSDHTSGNALWQFVNSFEGMTKGVSSFRYGTFAPSVASPVDPTKPHPMQINRLFAGNPDWSVHSRTKGDSYLSVYGASRQRGQLLHKAMERILYASDIIPVLDAMVAAYELGNEDAISLKQNLNTLMQNKLISECFQPGIQIKREAGMMDARGNYLRPDRVAIFPEKTVVMDFKTGKPLPGYQEQLHQYGSLLTEMGYPGVEKMLVYLDSGLVEVL